MTGHRTTDDLIRTLATSAVPAPPSSRRAAVAVLAATLCAIALFLLMFGVRPGLGMALSVPMVQAKILLPLVLAPLALGLCLTSTRPGARFGLWPLLLPLATGIALFGQRFASLPQDRLWPELIGQTAAACLLSITGLSLIPLAVGLVLLRRGAPTRPALSGALLGLACGAGITAGYALHCTEDSPMFFVPWYGFAICLAAGLGALAGHRALRW